MTDEDRPWPAFEPRGWARFATFLVALGLGHGAVRRQLQRVWMRGDSGTIADVTRQGLRWRLDFSDNVTDKHILFSSKERDRGEIRAISAACPKGGVFVDIGANTGYYTVRLASAGARVLALEPNPAAHCRLLFNVGLNGLGDRVTALPIGVGEEGETTLLFDDLGSGSTVAPDSAPNRLTIRTSPLADILASQGIGAVDALKIDVEGAEDRALAPFFGSAPRDAWPRCVVIEECHRDRWETDIVGLMLGEGYRKSARTRLNLVLSR